MRKKYNPPFINKKEKEIIESFENIDTTTIKKPTQKERQMFKNAAKKYLKKETKMNIRINHSELDKIKKYAKNEGLPYSSFIKSIIHKYITGQLIEKKSV